VYAPHVLLTAIEELLKTGRISQLNSGLFERVLSTTGDESGRTREVGHDSRSGTHHHAAQVYISVGVASAHTAIE
jgi:hypothetical protein